MKKVKLTLILLFSFLLSACSSSFVYNNLDWLLYWYVGDYVDLTLEQKNMLDERIALWQDWHRSTELVKYQSQLKSLRAKQALGSLNQNQWINELDEAQQHFYRFRNEIAPGLASMAQQLSPEQVEGLLAAWRKKTEKNKSEYEKQTKDERLVEQQKEMIENIEDNIGKLTPRQTELIRQYSSQFPSTFNERMAYQTKLQNLVREVFAKQGSAEFVQQLTSIIRDPEQYKTAQYKAVAEQKKRLYTQMLAELNLSLTAEQKKTLDAKLAKWISLIDDLIAD